MRAQPGSLGAAGWGGEDHAGPGACVGTAELLPLTRGRKHGSCRAACPSWSRKSSLPGWSGRSREESTGGQVRSAEPAPGSPRIAQGSALVLHRCQGAGGSEQGPEPPAQSQVGKTSWQQGPHTAGAPHAGHDCQGEPRSPPAAGEGGTWLTAQTKQVSCQLNPSASRNRSPASILKSQPRHLVPNIFS